MAGTITAFYNGTSITVFDVVAKEFGLTEGATIGSNEDFWKILQHNSIAGTSQCELDRVALSKEDG